jgi:hypothetical protein
MLKINNRPIWSPCCWCALVPSVVPQQTMATSLNYRCKFFRTKFSGFTGEWLPKYSRIRMWKSFRIIDENLPISGIRDRSFRTRTEKKCKSFGIRAQLLPIQTKKMQVFPDPGRENHLIRTEKFRPFRIRAYQDPGISGSGQIRIQAYQDPGISGVGHIRIRAYQDPGISGSGHIRIRAEDIKITQVRILPRWRWRSSASSSACPCLGSPARPTEKNKKKKKSCRRVFLRKFGAYRKFSSIENVGIISVGAYAPRRHEFVPIRVLKQLPSAAWST